MREILVALLIALLASQSTQAQPASEAVEARCTAEALDVSSAAWKEKMLSVGSFRLAVDPDTSRGPTTAITLESGKIRDPANPTNEPYLLAAVGDERRSCVVRMSFAQCPAAKEVIERLKQASVPLGLGLGVPSDALFVLHGSSYHVESVDGFGNHHHLVFREAGHPFEELITRSMDSLESCVQPAADSYHGR